MRHTSNTVAVPSQADTRLSSIGVTWSTDGLRACSYALDCKTAAESWSDRASFPVKRERSAHGGSFKHATRCDAQCLPHTPYSHPAHPFSCTRSNSHERILGVAIRLATGVPEVHWGRLAPAAFEWDSRLRRGPSPRSRSGRWPSLVLLETGCEATTSEASSCTACHTTSFRRHSFERAAFRSLFESVSAFRSKGIG